MKEPNMKQERLFNSHTYQTSSDRKVEILWPRIEDGQEKTAKGIVLETERAKKKRKTKNNSQKNTHI